MERKINKKFINKKYIPIYHNPDKLNEIDYNPGVKKSFFLIPIIMLFLSFISLDELTGEQVGFGVYQGINITKVFDPANLIFYFYIPIIFLTIVNIGFIFLGLFYTRQIGLGLYVGIILQRVYGKDAWKECAPCTFVRHRSCPGYSPFHYESELQISKGNISSKSHFKSIEKKHQNTNNIMNSLQITMMNYKRLSFSGKS